MRSAFSVQLRRAALPRRLGFALFLALVWLTADSRPLTAALTVTHGPGPSNVTATAATLSLRITATNAPAILPTNYFAWGTADAGTNLTAWANIFTNTTAFGLVQTNLTGLSSNTRYWYRAFARDATSGLVWASPSVQFKTLIGGIQSNYLHGATNLVVTIPTGSRTGTLLYNGAEVGTGAGPTNSFTTGETPTGVRDGVNSNFYLADLPIAGSVAVFVNGLRQHFTNDYLTVTNCITFQPGALPTNGDVILIDYRR